LQESAQNLQSLQTNSNTDQHKISTEKEEEEMAEDKVKKLVAEEMSKTMSVLDSKFDSKFADLFTKLDALTKVDNKQTKKQVSFAEEGTDTPKNQTEKNSSKEKDQSSSSGITHTYIYYSFLF